MNQAPPISTPVRTKTSALAVISLVLGIFAVVLCVISPVFAIPAIVCGHMAMSRIKHSGGLLGGRGVALAGLITGYLGLALLLLMLPIAIPNFVKARHTALKIGCINNLRQIDGAKQQWALDNEKKADAVPTEADLQPLINHDGGTWPECPAGGTYEIRSVGESPTCSVPEHELPH